MIGRHARDHPGKWLEAEDELLAAYPADDPGIRVRIMGGAASVAARLGHAPTGWDVLPFGLGGVADYIASLDAFVNFPWPQRRKAFGRTVVEAALAGRLAHLPACRDLAASLDERTSLVRRLDAGEATGVPRLGPERRAWRAATLPQP